MVANICLSKVFPEASEQHHPLQENATRQQATREQPSSCELRGEAIVYSERLEKRRRQHEEKKCAIERQRIIEEENAAKGQRDHQCEWCGAVVTSASTLYAHRQKHAENIPYQKVVYIPAAVPVIEEEKRIKKRQKEIKEEKNATKRQRGYSTWKVNVQFKTEGSLYP